MNEQEHNEQFRWRIMQIERMHRERMNKIKRDGARMRLFACPLAVLFFGVMAWYSLRTGMPALALVNGIAAGAFLVMLVGGMIFDRPSDGDS